MKQAEEQRRHEKAHKKKVIAEWKASARALKKDAGNDMLHRDARKISLARIEDAARTDEDFTNIITIWDNLDIVKRWRIDKQEVKSVDALRYYHLPDACFVLPEPLGYVWWRQLLRGEFLDTLNDCPYCLEELTTSRPMFDFIMELNDDQREILFYSAIRQWTPQKIAEIRGQTDRNIRKVYENMIENIRKKMYLRLYPRIRDKLPLTKAQKDFCEKYWDELDDKKKAKLKRIIEEEARKKRAEKSVENEQPVFEDKITLGEIQRV